MIWATKRKSLHSTNRGYVKEMASNSLMNKKDESANLRAVLQTLGLARRPPPPFLPRFSALGVRVSESRHRAETAGLSIRPIKNWGH